MKTKKLVLTAILSSLSLVLYEFCPIRISDIFTISLGIIPIFFISYFCGMLYSAIAAVIVDVVGFFIGSSGGPFMWGFTIGALIGSLLISLAVKLKDKINSKKGIVIITISMVIISAVEIPLYLYFDSLNGISGTYTDYSLTPKVIAIIGGALNLIIVLYSFIEYKKNGRNDINLAFILYQYVISLVVIPYTLNYYYGYKFIVLWSTRLISVPVMLLLYSWLTRIILLVIEKRYKSVE